MTSFDHSPLAEHSVTARLSPGSAIGGKTLKAGILLLVVGAFIVAYCTPQYAGLLLPEYTPEKSSVIFTDSVGTWNLGIHQENNDDLYCSLDREEIMATSYDCAGATLKGYIVSGAEPGEQPAATMRRMARALFEDDSMLSATVYRVGDTLFATAQRSAVSGSRGVIIAVPNGGEDHDETAYVAVIRNAQRTGSTEDESAFSGMNSDGAPYSNAQNTYPEYVRLVWDSLTTDPMPDILTQAVGLPIDSTSDQNHSTREEVYDV